MTSDTGKVSVEYIEVIQSIQDLNHSAPLIADKTTFIRVYLNIPYFADVEFVTGRLTIDIDEKETDVVVSSLEPLSNVVRFNLPLFRSNWGMTLNFKFSTGGYLK